MLRLRDNNKPMTKKQTYGEQLNSQFLPKRNNCVIVRFRDGNLGEA